MATLGPFQLIQKLGAGATAEVFLATGPNSRGEEQLALKVMLPHLAEDEGTRRAFLQEGRTAALLRHPNIVEVFDVGEVEGRGYLAMELVRGYSVSALLKKMKATKETLSSDEGCEIVRQAALGLHFAHEICGADGRPLGLVHRDVSPQNLIISETGEVKVADFGLAKATATSATVTRGIKGKLKYMPPEQLKGEPLDRRSDVFALGAVLWELITGQALYPGTSEAEIFQQALFNPQLHPDEVVRGLSRALVDLLQKAVEQQPERRCQTALALAEQLLPQVQPGESARKLGARVSKFFEPMPLPPQSSGSLAPVKRRSSLPAPPTRLKPTATADSSGRELQTIQSLPPVVDSLPDSSTNPALPPVSPTYPALSPMDTLFDLDTGASTHNMPAHVRPIRSRKMILPALLFAALGIFAAAIAAGRYLTQRNSAPVNQPPVASVEPDIPDEAPEPSRPAKKRAPVPKGFITIDANVPALVSLGGKDYGMTPVKMTLPVGRHKLKVATPDGALASDVELTIVAGGNGRKTVQLR